MGALVSSASDPQARRIKSWQAATGQAGYEAVQHHSGKGRRKGRNDPLP